MKVKIHVSSFVLLIKDPVVLLHFLRVCWLSSTFFTLLAQSFCTGKYKNKSRACTANQTTFGRFHNLSNPVTATTVLLTLWNAMDCFPSMSGMRPVYSLSLKMKVFVSKEGF